MLSGKYWLLKAEPDSRVVKGKDVKFSVDDFESVKTSPWEGVRNYEARNLMKEMRLTDKALFYHSNCKNPGVAGFAVVSREAYPDYTAWDPSHPYFDAKSKAEDPKWFMVDLTFISRAEHFIPLALLRYISEASRLPSEIAYIGEEGFTAIKNMDLVTRGRLSIQRVDEKAWDAISSLTVKGGWEGLDLKSKKGRAKIAAKNISASPKATRRVDTKVRPVARKKKRMIDDIEEDGADSDETQDQDDDDDYEERSVPGVSKARSGRKRRKGDSDDEEYASRRKSSTKAKR